MPLIDSFQTFFASTGRKYRATARHLRSGLTILTGYSPYVPKHLAIAPQDLRTADSSYAQEYYSGRYVLAGKLVETQAQSPFELVTADDSWKRELHSFCWLRNLSLSGDQLSGSHAKSLVKDWIRLEGKSSDTIAWDIEVASRRLIAWLQHSILILSVPDHAFHQEFMHCLGVHARFLKRHASVAPSGFPKLIAYLALAYASICFSGHASSLRFSREKLKQELTSQILADGSHVSRNAQTVVEILSYLLPYRQACVSVEETPSEEIITSCDRMFHALRLFRLGDGNFSRFNGAGATEADLVSTLLRYDESPNSSFMNSSGGEYQRLENETVVVLIDAGTPPRGELSQNAHAGCLSFEFSDGSDCIVVNTGPPAQFHGETSAYWRATAAHSTAIVEGTSSCKFEHSGQGENFLAGQMFSNSLKVESERKSDGILEVVTASHHGYVREFGVRHQRTLTFNKETGSIAGEDWFTGPDKGDLYYTTKDRVAIRFHIHPNVHAALDEEGASVVLQTRSGTTWKFSCNEVTAQLEESVYLAGFSGMQKTQQIVLRFHACKTPQVGWMFSPVT